MIKVDEQIVIKILGYLSCKKEPDFPKCVTHYYIIISKK